MTPLERHRQKKAILDAWYGKLLDEQPDWIPAGCVSSAERASLTEARDNLRHERFVVAVCGQMKAGKSTLLNALVFGEPVLPAAATTMTAKVTLMEGAEAPRVEATLYTAAEFDAVVKAASQDPTSAAELTKAREAARQSGLREQALLTSPPRVESRRALSALTEFCAIPDNGGRYTPYVKAVHLWADRRWLHEVTVADTPGTNDPNPERDKVTREWINQADAVVYVTYAGQAGLDQNDVDFLDRYLHHIDPDKRVMAVNKIDTQDDLEAIHAHFRAMGKSTDLRLQALFGPNVRPPVLVSGLGGLVATMNAAGKPVGPGLAEDADWLADNGWLAPQRHRLGVLQEEIEERILKTKGDALLAAHRRKIEAVLTNAERQLEAAREAGLEGVRAAQASQQDLDEQQKKVEGAIAHLAEFMSDLREEVDSVTEELMNAFNAAMDREPDIIAGKMIEKLRGVRDFSNIASHAAWAVPEVLRQRRSVHREALGNAAAGAKEHLAAAESRIGEFATQSGFADHRKPAKRLRVDFDYVLNSVLTKVENEDRSAYHQIAEESAGAIRRFFNTNAARYDAVERLAPMLSAAAGDAIENLKEHATRAIYEGISRVLESFEDTLRKQQNLRLRDIQELKAAGTERRALGEAHQAAALAAGAGLDRLASIRSELTAALGVA